jgi:hypothetical protein
VGKILETIYSTFFTWCCFSLWEFLLTIYLVCIVVILYVFVVPYVYLLCYVRIVVLTLDAGLLARSQYPEGPATGHLDTGFSWFPCVYKQMLRWFPSSQVATTCFSCSPTDLNSLVTFFSVFVSVLGVSEVRWKEQGEIRSGDYTVYYWGGERAERGVAIVVHKSVVRSVVKKIVTTESLLLS